VAVWSGGLIAGHGGRVTSSTLLQGWGVRLARCQGCVITAATAAPAQIGGGAAFYGATTGINMGPSRTSLQPASALKPLTQPDIAGSFQPSSSSQGRLQVQRKQQQYLIRSLRFRTEHSTCLTQAFEAGWFTRPQGRVGRGSPDTRKLMGVISLPCATCAYFFRQLRSGSF